MPTEYESERIRLGPIEFAENKLQIECWPKMREIMQAIQDGKRRILVRSCNGAGKTTTIAALCNWKLSQFDDSIVLTTASSWTQVRRTLWGEIRKQARKLDYDKKLIAQTNIRLSDKHYALGISPRMPENAMGFHSPHMLIAVDEATGIDREIIDALSGNLTGEDAQMILICNPINTHSYPYEAEESGDWHLITISAFEHPNVVTGKEVIKGAVTRKWIEDRLKAWSHEVEAPGEITNFKLRITNEIQNEDVILSTAKDRVGSSTQPNDTRFFATQDSAASSTMLAPSCSTQNDSRSIYVHWLDKRYKKTPIVASRILGEWADNDSEGIITMEVISKCVQQPLHTNAIQQHNASGIKSLGVDIARGGTDETVFAMFDGDVQLPFETFYHSDLMQTANRVKQKYDEGFKIIAIDDSGLGGGVTDRLKELGITIYPVNFNHKPRGFLKHRKDLANARAEMYFVLQEELREESLKLLDDKLFHQELSATRLTTNEHSLAYRMEDKELVRRRLGRSPDRADATALARYAVRLKAHEKRAIFF